MSYRVLNLRGKRLNEAFDYEAEFEKTGNKKYVLDMNETKNVDGHTLYRIFYKDGIKGGWLESYKNLSQDGTCKVLEDAVVMDRAYVFGNAEVSGNAKVFNGAAVFGNAIIYGDAEVYGKAYVHDNTKVYGKAQVHGEASVSGNAEIYGNAVVSDFAEVYGNAKVYGKAWVYGEAEIDYNVSEGEIAE